MTATITEVEVHDVRLPTSERRDGSGATHPDPDCCAAYAVPHTDDPAGLSGHGLCFTIGRGDEAAAAAIGALMDDEIVEYVPHLHEHFTDPVVVDNGRYRAPRMPGFSSRTVPESAAAHRYPDGPVWTTRLEALR